MNSLSSALAPTLAEEKVTETVFGADIRASEIAISEPNPTLINDIKII